VVVLLVAALAPPVVPLAVARADRVLVPDLLAVLAAVRPAVPPGRPAVARAVPVVERPVVADPVRPAAEWVPLVVPVLVAVRLLVLAVQGLALVVRPRLVRPVAALVVPVRVLEALVGPVAVSVAVPPAPGPAGRLLRAVLAPGRVRPGAPVLAQGLVLVPVPVVRPVAVRVRVSVPVLALGLRVRAVSWPGDRVAVPVVLVLRAGTSAPARRVARAPDQLAVAPAEELVPERRAPVA